MEAISPSPISTPSGVTPPPPYTQPSSPPPSKLNATSPPMTTPPQSPPVNVTSPPPAKLPTSPPPQQSSPPPPSFSPPPPFVPPLNSPPPPSTSPPPISPTPPAIPPRTSAPPPPSTNPPKISPPPSQPSNSPPPPALIPPKISPPPPALIPPISSPPPPALIPPISSPPPPALVPPTSSPPPPPTSSPPPPALVPPTSSPPPPGAIPPKSSPPPPPSAEPPKTSPPSPTSPPPPATIPGSGPSNTPPPASSVPTGSPPTFPRPIPPSSSGASPSGASLPSPSGNPTNSTSSTKTSGNSRSTGGRGISNEGTVAIGLIFGLLFLGSVGMSAWCIRKRKKKKNSGSDRGHVLPTSDGSSPHPDSLLLKVGTSATNTRIGSGNSRSWFTYEELLAATDGFASHNLLGEGGFGSVYKGHLRDGREVAVKQLRVGGGQGEREFRAEVEIISRVHHRHLVTLVGYCISENRRMLVYDYIPNNNLYFHLHENGEHVMDWAIRLKVAAGAARGIAYLHEDCHPRIVHRDIKSSNILIDDNFEARVSDFGLARLFEDSNTHISTRVMGTFGYMAPEYASSGKLTEKSDVFSYGVVLLELITGRKPVDESQPPGEESLVEWARPLLSHALESRESEGLVDPRLQNNYVDSEMARVIEIAAACVRHSAIKRPQMGQVLRVFESMSTSDLSNGMRVGESQIVNPQHSEEMRLFHRMAFGIQDFSTAFFDQSSSHAEP